MQLVNISNEQIIIFLWIASAGALLFQVVIVLVALSAFRANRREQAGIEREMFGLVKRIEGLTATKREQILKHYDSMLATLSHRLPPIIAAETSQKIFETESRILSRLAELEPNVKDDVAGKKKLDDLICSMESLEATLVASAAETVKKVMSESRRSLFDDEADLSNQLEM